MEKYKFSVVINILENQDFLKKTIINIIKQTVNFKSDVQLILVGSIKSDLKRYLNKYPNNIKTLDMDCFDRNIILNFCQGKYIHFIKPNDIFSKNTFKEVYNFFEANCENIDMVSVPFFLCKEKRISNNKYTALVSGNHIIDLKDEPQNFVTPSSNTFYKRSVICNLDLDSSLIYNASVDLNFKMYAINSKFGYVCSKGVKYFYTKQEKNITIEKEYADIYTILGKMVSKELEDYEKEYILYEIMRKLKNMVKDSFESLDFYDEIIQNFQNYLSFLDDDFIVNKTKIVKKIEEKYFFLKFKKTNFSFNIDLDGNILFNDNVVRSIFKIHVKIKKFEVTNDFINLDLMFNDFNIKDLNLRIYDLNDQCYEPYYEEKIKSSYDLKFGEFNYKKMRLLKFKIPLKEGNLSFEFVNKQLNERYLVTNVSMLSFICFTMKDSKIHLFKNNYVVSYNGHFINVWKDKYNLNKYKISTFLYFVKRYKYMAFSRLLKVKNPKYILLCDRPEKAGDNGEALFKYINDNDKELAKNTYFVIAKKGKEYKRLKTIGKVILKNSIKHKYMYLNAKLIASSHACKDFYMPFGIKKLKYYVDLLDYKFVWLQHGIIHNNVAKSINKYNANIDYFVVSGFQEQMEIQKESYFYESSKVILTGMPRYDYLEADNRNIISLLPTWRRSLSGKIMKSGFHEIKDGFSESDYYKQYASILSDSKLINLLKEKNFTLQFILHPGMAGYEEYFYKFKSSQINIISASDVDYNKVFKESNLLITDYSSVAFDFSYLKKPLIYFQFDRDLFFSNHYEPGYFDYIKDGFGEVLTNSDLVIKKIEYYFDNSFKVEDEFSNNVDKIFAFNDKENSKRIIELLKNDNIL